LGIIQSFLKIKNKYFMWITLHAYSVTNFFYIIPSEHNFIIAKQ
jgi:hypothetical protein